MSSGDFAGAYTRLADVEDLEYGGAGSAHDRQAGVASTSAPAPPGSDGSAPSHLGAHGGARHLAAAKAKDRKKKLGRKVSWLILHQDGSSQRVLVDKRQLTQARPLGAMGLEIPMRDLRLMDPALQTWEAYAQILVRDNAMVFSVEHVRAILAADKVLIPLDFEKNEVAERFTAHLEATIKERAADEAARRQATAANGFGTPARGTSGGGGGGGGLGGAPSGGGSARDEALHMREADLDLPFELHMLEVALGEVRVVWAVCRHLAQKASALEAIAHPALDALTRNADTVNLERVRKIKTQHQRISGRVAGLREVLERYMEDDQDMYRMCLSKRRETDVEPTGSDNTLMLGRPTPGRHHLTAAQLLRSHSHSHSMARSPGAFLERMGSSALKPRGLDSDSSTATSDVHDLLEVENLLESYYMMVDSTHHKLNGIGEYIDDTEDYINIELDYSRNRLLRLEIMITVATFCLALYNLLAGVLGENLVLPSAITQDIRGFIAVNGTALTLCIALFFVSWRTMQKRKMI
ncbi:MAG: hypothetical protein J3K34DRAFT_526053 [Monoraphidium minutum]|nr:MAG: hypothetical protein J3K34DRAFT_526053 [Monoraphidium minutum]